MKNRTLSFRILRFIILLILVTNTAFLSDTLEVSSEVKSYNTAYVSMESDVFLSSMSKEVENKLDQVFPEYFEIDDNGELKHIRPINPKIINTLHSKGIEVVPSLNSKYLHNKKLFEHCNELTDSLVTEIKNNNLDGINIDANDFTLDGSLSFLTFVKQLREKLGPGKTIVLAFNMEPSGFNNTRTTNSNLGSLAKLSDYLLLKPFYNYSGTNNIDIATDTAYMEKVLQSALLKVPKDKLVIGVSKIGGRESVILKDRLANKYGVKGVCYWEIESLTAAIGEADVAIEQKDIINNPVKKYDKNAYLTFDDGPDAKITPKILDVLKDNNVKATFFINGVWAQDYPELVRRMHNEGHSIGNHTYSHKVNSIYKSWSSLKAEIEKTNSIIYKLTGEKCSIFRAPGGSKPYLSKVYKANIHEMGMKIFDWNCDPKDWQAGKNSKASILSAIKKTPSKKELFIILHSRKDRVSTLEALPDIIKYLETKKYNLVPITNGTKECLF